MYNNNVCIHTFKTGIPEHFKAQKSKKLGYETLEPRRNVVILRYSLIRTSTYESNFALFFLLHINNYRYRKTDV